MIILNYISIYKTNNKRQLSQCLTMPHNHQHIHTFVALNSHCFNFTCEREEESCELFYFGFSEEFMETEIKETGIFGSSI